MGHLLEEVRARVMAPGPFSRWKHEASNQARPDVRNLSGAARTALAYCRDLPAYTAMNSRADVRRVVFATLQNLYPLVEAIDTDAGLYLAQAVEALRKVGADI